MATKDPKFVEDLIVEIEQAEAAESVTNGMVAAVLDYLHESDKDLSADNENH